jgi:hypothetical protein
MIAFMRSHLAGTVFAGLFVLLLVRTAEPLTALPTLPGKISDKEYWRLISDLSEKSGYFHSENFVSNETGYQKIIPKLKERIQPNGVYLGVGPEQNFTFIAALHPKIAFIVDIRRQNLVEHLMYKALFELSADRADFLSRLFSVRRPAGLDVQSTVDELFGAFDKVAIDQQQFDRNLSTLKDVLLHRHGFALTEADVKMLEHVYATFQESGANLNYAVGSKTADRMPTFSELMRERDGEDRAQGFLASEASYQSVRDLEVNNLIIPVVGDFAGPKAIREVGRYLKSHGATVSVFYLSNVESYLFTEADVWVKFYVNVAILPSDANSLFLRSVMERTPTSEWTFGFTSEELLCPIDKLMNVFSNGSIVSYQDVIDMSSTQ